MKHLKLSDNGFFVYSNIDETTIISIANDPLQHECSKHGKVNHHSIKYHVGKDSFPFVVL